MSVAPYPINEDVLFSKPEFTVQKYNMPPLTGSHEVLWLTADSWESLESFQIVLSVTLQYHLALWHTMYSLTNIIMQPLKRLCEDVNQYFQERIFCLSLEHLTSASLCWMTLFGEDDIYTVSPVMSQLDGFCRGFSWHRHCYFGYFHSGLHAALCSPVGRNVGVSVLAVGLQAIVQLLATAPAGVAGAEEGVPHVLAPQGVDDWVDGGVEQAQHAAECKYCLDVIVHTPEEVVDHDGEHWAPTYDQHHQDEHQGLGQADVHAGLLRARAEHFSPICWVNNEALLGGSAQHAHSVVVCFPQDVHVGVDDEKNQHTGDTDPEHQVVLINKRE